MGNPTHDDAAARAANMERYGTAGGGAATADRRAFPTSDQRRRDPDWTLKHPRPTAGDVIPELLATSQRLWDEAEAKRRQREELARPIREKRAAEAKARREAEAARRAEHERARADALEGELRRRYLAVPGATPAGWEAEKATILAEHRRHQTLSGSSADEAARVANARRYF